MTEECPQGAVPPCDVRSCPNPGIHRVIDTLDIYGLWGHPIDWKPLPGTFVIGTHASQKAEIVQSLVYDRL